MDNILQDPKALLAKRDDLDMKAVRRLKEILKMTDYDPGRRMFLQIIAEYDVEDVEDAKEFIKETEKIVRERDDVNDKYISALRDRLKKS